MASSSKKPSTTERKRPRAETKSRGSDLTATSAAPAKASAPSVTSPRRPPAKRPKTVKPPKEHAAPKMAPPVIAAGPTRGKGKAKATGSSGDAPLYIGGSESSEDDTHPPKHAERTQHSPTPSASEDDDLTISLHARTKAAAVMAGIAVPPGSHHDRFKKRYMQYSAEKTLEIVSANWTSPLYKHFHEPVIVHAPNGSVIYRFKCRRHPSKYVDRMDYQDSTGNLSRHVKMCDPNKTPEAKMITAFASGVTYSAARLRFLLAMWVVRRHRPFTIVEDPEFQQIVCMLYAKAQLPSRVTLSRDVQAIFAECKGKVIDYFQNIPSKIHICVDGWTAPNIISFLGVTAHWHEGGKVKHVILDFIKLTKSHTGKYLAEKLVDCLKGYGIAGKILAVTCDNAENNTTMIDEMELLIPGFRGSCACVRCFGHILNLVVKAIMSQFDRETAKRKKQKAGDTSPEDAELVALDDKPGEVVDEPDTVHEDDIEAAEEGDPAREASDDQLIDDLDDEHPELVVSPADIKFARVAVEKITKLGQRVWHSPRICEELAVQARNQGLHSDVLIRPVKTRWNTMVEVLQRAIALRVPLYNICQMHQFNTSGSVRLNRFALTADEWLMIGQLHALLEVFLFATREISQSTQPLIHHVIPWIDMLTKHLDDFLDDLSLHSTVRAAATRGRVLLNKYYSLTDESNFYRVAMILHPAYKLSYFDDQKWPDSWKREALRLVKEEWDIYKPGKGRRASVSSESEGEGISSQSAPPVHCPGPGRRSAQAASRMTATTRALLMSMRKGPGGASHNELDPLKVYLEASPLVTIKDPLAYWNGLLESGCESPELARMALDILSIPASSTDVERAFSCGRLTVSHLCRSLSDKSVRVNTVLGSWAAIPDLVHESELVALFDPQARKD